MGYAQSKLVAEHLCIKAAQQTGIQSRVLRIGQVIGDTDHGIWNTTEAIPLMIQAATTIGALPKLDEYHRWLPVNVVAGIIADISLSAADTFKYDASATDAQPIFNIINSNPFHWARELRPYLRASGLEFEEIGQRDWIKRLRESNPDPVANPPIKLVDFFASKYDNDIPKSPIGWATEKTAGASGTFVTEAKNLDLEMVGKMIKYFRGPEGWGK